jgi:hypothetical protein
MTISVLIEPIVDGGFRATGGSPFVASAHGATRAEALDRLRLEIEGKIAAGAVLVPLEVGSNYANPWTNGAGMFKDNPLFDAWQESIADYRRSVDEDSGSQ